MATTFEKIIRVLKAPNTLQRSLQAINKSPVRHVLKYLAILSSPKVHFARKKLIQTLRLTDQENSVVKALNEYGYAEVTDLINLQKREELMAYGLEKLNRAETVKKQQTNTNKDFWVRLSDEDIGDKDLLISMPMVKVALDPAILNITGGYLKEPGFLEYVLLTLSNYSGETLKSSQLWHFDRDDTKMLKLFMYLTDVNSVSDGPFTFINKVNSKKVKNSFIMRHLEDAEVKKYVSPSDWVQMVKPKLSCFLVDTSQCYHMGSRLHQGHFRLMFTALFAAPPSNYLVARKEQVRAAKDQCLTGLELAAIKVKV